MGELPAMNNISECSYMELWCRQHANDDPGNNWRWLGQAERWRELGQRRANESLRQRRQMTAGPMEMGPNPITGKRQMQQS
jgi:hypothetical protein